MPETDGFTLAEQIVQDPEISSTIVMMLTSGDRPEDVARCAEHGIAAYLLKPVKQSELFDAIMLALGIDTAEEGPAAASGDQVPRLAAPLCILLAEDSLVNQKLAVALLERHGHAVVVANNGREAVSAAESGSFDLVLMDVQMPELDGLEATAIIRAREKQSGVHLPNVSKPIRAGELFHTLNRLLAVPEKRRENAGHSPPEPMAPAFDWRQALDAVEGDEAILRVVAEAALEEIPPLMAALGEAVAQRDAAALRFAAHKLQGAIRYFGPTPIFEQVCSLETTGDEGRIDEASAMLAVLEREIGRLSAALTRCVSRPES
jgi:CheY-like chemotaxis protein